MKNIIKSIILSLLMNICFAPVAYADEISDYKISVGIPAYTKHFHTRNEHGKEWNQGTGNYGAFLEVGRRDSDLAVLVGNYRNSYFKNTTLAGVTYRPIHLGDLSVGVVGALVTGYREPVLAALSMEYQFTDHIGVHAIAGPTIAKRSGLVAIQLTLTY